MDTSSLDLVYPGWLDNLPPAMLLSEVGGGLEIDGSAPVQGCTRCSHALVAELVTTSPRCTRALPASTECTSAILACESHQRIERRPTARRAQWESTTADVLLFEVDDPLVEKAILPIVVLILLVVEMVVVLAVVTVVVVMQAAVAGFVMVPDSPCHVR